MRNHRLSLEGKPNRLFVIASVLVLSACAGGTEVVLSNQSTASMEGVSVQFTGGTTAPQPIPAGHAATVTFDPTGESHLVVVYASAAGTQTCHIDTYLERNYRAVFHIDLFEQSCRVVHEEVELPGVIVVAPQRPSPDTSFTSTPLRGAD